MSICSRDTYGLWSSFLNDSQAGELEPGGSFTMGPRATYVIPGVSHLRFQVMQMKVYTPGRLTTRTSLMDKPRTGFNKLLVSFTATMLLLVSLRYLESDDCARKIHILTKRQCVLCRH
jgi:hypothetical protein